MHDDLGEGMGGAVVQAMAGPGVETIVGVVNDPSFGPLVTFGSGGTAVELFGDQAFRMLPMTDADAAGLEELILRVARLAEDFPEITEMDLNPVIVGRTDVHAVDVKIRVARAGSSPDLTVRRLP
jgi:acyl-CoA synthetase (NDP forming)